MDEFRAVVPTYYGDALPDQVASGEAQELDEPFVPFVVRVDSGIRVVLGTHEFENLLKPDILIERRPSGWVIMLHPLPGSDPSGYVYFLDDGRSFLVPEYDFGPTSTIEVLATGARIPDGNGNCK